MKAVSRTFLFFLLLVCSVLTGQAQHTSPYAFSVKKDIPLLVGGAALFTGSYIWRINVKPFTEAQVLALDRNNVNSIDRFATRLKHGPSILASDIFLYSSLAIPLATMGFKKGRKDALLIGLMYTETLLLTNGITLLTKNIALRPRPLAYNPAWPMETRISSSSRFSFFSGHTSMAASMTFLTAKIISDYTDKGYVKAIAWGLGASIPAAVGFFRVSAGKHFLTDVVTGYIVGGAIGYLVPVLHRKKVENPKVEVSLLPGMNSATLLLRF